MKKTIKIFSIVFIVIGSLAILASAGGGTDAWASFIGGTMFLGNGICVLIYLNQENK